MTAPSRRLADALDVIPVVADAAARDARFPHRAAISRRQRVQRLDTGAIERWAGTEWVAMICAECVTCCTSLTGAPLSGRYSDGLCAYTTRADLFAHVDPVPGHVGAPYKYDGASPSSAPPWTSDLTGTNAFNQQFALRQSWDGATAHAPVQLTRTILNAALPAAGVAAITRFRLSASWATAMADGDVLHLAELIPPVAQGGALRVSLKKASATSGSQSGVHASASGLVWVWEAGKDAGAYGTPSTPFVYPYYYETVFDAAGFDQWIDLLLATRSKPDGDATYTVRARVAHSSGAALLDLGQSTGDFEAQAGGDGVFRAFPSGSTVSSAAARTLDYGGYELVAYNQTDPFTLFAPAHLYTTTCIAEVP